MSSVTPEALRAAALARVTPHTDPRVADVLKQATYAVEHDVSEWQSSEGRVLAHRVHVGLGAALLGSVRGNPHVVDDVTRIISVAMAASTTGDRAGEIAFRHDLGAGAPASFASAYRGQQVGPQPSPADSAPSTDLAALARAYLVAFGDAAAAEIAGRATIAVTTRQSRGEDHHDVRLTLAAQDASATPSQHVLLEICLRELLCTHPTSRVRFAMA